MEKAIRFYEAGSPDVLRYEDTSVGQPGAVEVFAARGVVLHEH